jgi:hypothetical protein
LEFFPGRACPLKAKPVTGRESARHGPTGRDGVEGGGTRRQSTEITGETLFGPAAAVPGTFAAGREANKGRTRNRRNDAEQGVGGGRSTAETRDNRVEGRTAASTTCPKRGTAAGLPPRGKALPRPKAPRPQRPTRLDPARKLQRTLYRVPTSAWATATGCSTRLTGRCGVNCNSGFAASTVAPGGRPGPVGPTTSFMVVVDCTAWWGR